MAIYFQMNQSDYWSSLFLSAPDGPHVGPVNLAIRVCIVSSVFAQNYSRNSRCHIVRLNKDKATINSCHNLRIIDEYFMYCIHASKFHTITSVFMLELEILEIQSYPFSPCTPTSLADLTVFCQRTLHWGKTTAYTNRYNWTSAR